jgi:hypothetical protein
LLDPYDIQPVNVGPSRVKGYRATDFADAFARYLSADPLIRSESVTVVSGLSPAKRRKAKKRKKSGCADVRPHKRRRATKRK